MKRHSIFAVLAALSVLAIPFALFAQDSPFNVGDGSLSSPYLIASSSDLSALASLVNAPATNAVFADKHYLLTADIDLSGMVNWEPIGAGLMRTEGASSSDVRLTFRGVFDGGGHKISNLRITEASRLAGAFQGQGLFGVVDGGTVKNLRLIDVGISIDAGQVGGIAGAAVMGSVIADSYVTGNVSGTVSVGGVAGHVDYGSVISNGYVLGGVSGALRVGGIAGHVYSGCVITDSYVMGTVMKADSVITDVAGYIWNSAVINSEVLEDGAALPPGFPEIVSDVLETDLGASSIVATVNNSSGRVTVGPNPINRQSGPVDFFRCGEDIKKSALTIYDASGKVVKKISIADANGSFRSARADGRVVGSWDLTNRRGRPVAAGTYLIRGVITTSGGQKESVSILLGVQ